MATNEKKRRRKSIIEKNEISGGGDGNKKKVFYFRAGNRKKGRTQHLGQIGGGGTLTRGQTNTKMGKPYLPKGGIQKEREKNKKENFGKNFIEDVLPPKRLGQERALSTSGIKRGKER